MKITIEEVTDRCMLRRFVKFLNQLYAHNKYFVPQIVSMDMDTFTPGVNRAFEICEGKFYLAKDEAGKIVGRVAAIINHQYNTKINDKVCRFGWIDFIESEEVCHALLAKVEEYAKEHGMRAVEGPLGFLEFDVSGVLVEGFDKLPTPYGKYNDPYYEPMILSAGYTQNTDFVEYLLTLPNEVPEKYIRMSKIVAEKYNLHQATLKSKKDILRYADGVFDCMNRCYSKLHGYSELSPGQCDDLKKQFVPNLDPDFVSIILDSNDKVVAFNICLPSLSRALQKAKGSLFPLGWLYILCALRHNDTVNTLLIAIDDEYKNKGLNAMLFEKVGTTMIRHKMRYIESTRELETNVAVQNLGKGFEYDLCKRARVYHKDL